MTGAFDSLKGFVQIRQEISQFALSAHQVIEKLEERYLEDQSRAILQKLAEDRFNLVVAGQFKRGKSSLINAILGRNLLPVGLLPLTSAITALTYGPTEQVFLQFKGWVLEQEIPLEELGDYITERGNPGNQKNLVMARVELPEPFLRRGLYFIDTPGIGSSRLENTQTTYGFLPNADGIIFVTSVDSPFSEAEELFLSDVRTYARKLFVVVNKLDLLGPAERPEVLEYIGSNLKRILGEEEFHTFPLSAKEGLAAKLGSDAEGQRASDLAAFEENLTEFLTQEKELTLFVSVLDQLDRLLQSVLSMETGETVQSSLQSVWEEVQAYRQNLLAGASSAETGPADRPPAGKQAAPPPQGRADPSSPRKPAELVFYKTACPICAAEWKLLFDYFAEFQYQLVTAPALREQFARSHGFCHFHTWQFEKIASPQGISVGYLPLIDTVLTELRRLGEDVSPDSADLSPLFPGERSCPACQFLQTQEKILIHQLVARLEEESGRDLYRQTAGVCIPHLIQIAGEAPDPERNRFLLAEQVRQLEDLSEELQSYTLKRAALRRGLVHRTEENAWQRLLLKLAGDGKIYWKSDHFTGS